MELLTNIFKLKKNNISPQKGTILISEPFLQDAYFKRSVVLLVEHNEEGSLGFILNKEVDFTIYDTIKDFPKFDTQFNLGGPVATDTVHFIHTLGEAIPGAIKVTNDLYWGGDFDFLKLLIRQNQVKPNQVRFFIGYSGWTEKQLEAEMKINSWLVSNATTDFVMNKNRRFWKNAVLGVGTNYKMWTNFPENPNFN